MDKITSIEKSVLELGELPDNCDGYNSIQVHGDIIKNVLTFIYILDDDQLDIDDVSNNFI